MRHAERTQPGWLAGAHDVSVLVLTQAPHFEVRCPRKLLHPEATLSPLSRVTLPGESLLAERGPIGAPQPAPERTDTERDVAAARAALGEPQWAAALEAGQTLQLEQAIAGALDEANCEPRV